VSRYIAGGGLVDHPQQIPMAMEARSWIGNMKAVVPIIGSGGGGDGGSSASALDFFVGTQLLAFNFYPLLTEPERLTNANFADTQDPKSIEAALHLRARLLRISRRIREREVATMDAPKYTLLDPTQLPFHSYI
jgi:hypothetical protein